MRFVLTGRAVINDQFIDRRDLTLRIDRNLGDCVVDSFNQGGDILVASRTDTSKATSARLLGKPVWDYTKLNQYLRMREGGMTEWDALDAFNQRRTAASGVDARAPIARQRPSRTVDVPGAERIQYPASLTVRMEAKKVEPHQSSHVLSNGKRAIDL